MRTIRFVPDNNGVTMHISEGLYTRYIYFADEELEKLQSEISKYLGGK